MPDQRIFNERPESQDRALKVIEKLEKELEQWQQKKKSLMQLLLTGIVRVDV